MVAYPRRHGAGRSAARRHRNLARAWRHRVFGRRFSLYFWATFAVLLFGAAKLDLRPPWGVYVGMFFGCALTAWLLIPEALMPWWISSWRAGRSSMTSRAETAHGTATTSSQAQRSTSSTPRTSQTAGLPSRATRFG